MSWIQERPDLAQVQGAAPRTRSSPRRTHTKSKHGCASCKKRRIKCDESYPACGQCRDKGTKCIFPVRPPSGADNEAASSTTATTATSSKLDPDRQNDTQRADGMVSPVASVSSVPSLSSGPSIPESPPIPTPFPRELSKARMMMHLELVNQPCSRDFAGSGYSRSDVPELLDHYTDTHEPWAGSPECQRISQTWGPTLSITNTFLLHGILAFSASHLQALRPWEPKYATAASLHYGLSLKGFSTSLGDSVSRENADALFACCYLHAMLAFHNKPRPDEPGVRDNDFAWLRLMKGIPILQRTNVLRPHLNKSLWLPVFIESGAYSAETGPLPAPVHAKTAFLPEIESLREQCGVTQLDPNDDDNPYAVPLVHLDRLSRMKIDSSKIGTLMVFIGRMPESFVVLVEKLDVRALKILAQWCEFASQVEQWWCTRPARDEAMRLKKIIADKDSLMTPESIA